MGRVGAPTQTSSLIVASPHPSKAPQHAEMALQNPHSPTAETRTFAGPWLRFGSGTGPLDGREWRGSVLCLTRASGQAVAAAAFGGTAAGPDGSAARPGFPAAGTVAGPAAAGAGLAQAAAAGGTAAPRPVLLLRDARSGSGGGGELRLDQPTALDSCEGWTAWRFDLELSLTEWQRPVDYSVQAGVGCGNCIPRCTLPLAGSGASMAGQGEGAAAARGLAGWVAEKASRHSMLQHPSLTFSIANA